DSYLDTKDAFWHAKNVTVKNSTVKGEYLAWFSDGEAPHAKGAEGTLQAGRSATCSPCLDPLDCDPRPLAQPRGRSALDCG
ncbi:MAG: DUF3737 family protein, partial [Alistipes sp.]|nr:DUF3737 family protein [Alistipes sp.]